MNETKTNDPGETVDASDSLFEIKQQHRQVLSELERIDRKVAQNEGVYPEGLAEREEELEEKLLDLGDTLEEKYRRYGHVISELQAEAKSLHARAAEYQKIVDRIKDRAKRKEDRVDRMKNRILEDMQVREIEEVDAGDFVFSLRWKTARKTKVTSPAESLPDRFRREDIRFKYSAEAVDKDVRELLRDLVQTVEAAGSSVKVKLSADKRAIKEALKEGDEEAQQHAHLEERKRQLQVK